MGATLAFVVGGAVVAPSFTRRQSSWRPAARVIRPRGRNTEAGGAQDRPRRWRRAKSIDRRIVYLVRSGDSVRALDSTCTHLGCRTRFNPDSKRIECPCHGGMYDVSGRVIGGPPPSPLQNLPTRVENDRVLVEI